MPNTSHSATQPAFDTFGEMLRYLRRRARLTQQELGIAVGYSESYITRLEGDSRLPVPGAVRSLFIDALNLHDEPRLAHRLIELAEASRGHPHLQAGEPFTAQGVPRRSNLPAHLTRFIGRARELAEVESLIAANRLVTMTGSGGVGKTRLAQQAATATLDRFADGVWIAELGPLGDATLVPQIVAGALRLPIAPAAALIEALCAHLADKHALLLLDNCEHLIQACAELAEALLRACPRVSILATSREALHIPGEVAWRVPPMDSAESVQLFADRAAAAKAGFVVDDRTAPIVASIGQRLDGIPLAIELAASRVSGLSVDQLAARLGDRFRLLTDGSRTALPRHQTLRALIDWSYDLLSDQERVLFRRLAVFAGGWMAEAAEQVCAAPRLDEREMLDLFAPNVLPLLLHLVSKSLIVADARGTETRYRMLETIREYAIDMSPRADADAQALKRVRRRHLEYYADLVQAGRLTIAGGTWHWIWNDAVAAEVDNTRAALDWAAQCGDWRTGWRLLTGALGVWTVLGRLEFSKGNVAGSIDRYRAASQWAHRLRDEALILEADGALGFLTPDYETATRLLNSVIALAHRSGRKSWAAGALTWLAARLSMRGEQQRAHDALATSLRLAREAGSPVTLAGTLGPMGRFLFERGDVAEARAMLEESVRLNRGEGLQGWVVGNLEDLAEIGLDQGDVALVRQALSESLPYHYQTREMARTARGLAAAAGLAHLIGRPAQAARLLGAADTLLGAQDAPGIFETELTAVFTRLVPIVRAELDSAIFDGAWAEGRQRTLAQSVVEALAV